MKWFRYYHDALHDPKVRRLPDRLYRHWVGILCIASANKPRGVLPDTRDVADHLRVSPQQAAKIVAELQAAKLLDETRRGLMPHNWPKRQPISDNATERMRNKRRTRSEHLPKKFTLEEEEEEEERGEGEKKRDRREENPSSHGRSV